MPPRSCSAKETRKFFPTGTIQRAALDLCPTQAAFLFAYLDCHSKTAAKLLLETDLEFVLKRCDDGQILTLLDLFDEKSTFLDILQKPFSPLSQRHRLETRSGGIILALAEETMPEPYDHRIVLQHSSRKNLLAPLLASTPKKSSL